MIQGMVGSMWAPTISPSQRGVPSTGKPATDKVVLDLCFEAQQFQGFRLWNSGSASVFMRGTGESYSQIKTSVSILSHLIPCALGGVKTPRRSQNCSENP